MSESSKRAAEYNCRPLAVGISLCCFLAMAASSVWAEGAGDFNQAVKEYSAKNYIGARDKLLSYLKANNESYQAHYLLGNCYMQLADLANAKRSYALALTNNPDAVTKDRCLKTIDNINQAKSATAVKPSPSAHSVGTPAEHPATGNLSATHLRIKQLEAELVTIQKDADSQLAKIREEMKAALASYCDRLGSLWTYPNGEVKYELSREQETECKAPFEAKMEQISKDLETRLASKRKEIDDLNK